MVALSETFEPLGSSFDASMGCQDMGVSRDIFDVDCDPLDDMTNFFSPDSLSSIPDWDFAESEKAERRPSLAKTGKGRTPFPRLLHLMLETAGDHGHSDIVSWQPHGKCFVVHKPKEFVIHIMPRLFRQTKWSSFQRQLNLYGFNRITEGPDKGGYYHFLFLRGKADLCDSIIRTKIKGTRVRRASNPQSEPNFYSMTDAEYEMHRRKSLDCMTKAARRSSMPNIGNREISLLHHERSLQSRRRNSELGSTPYTPCERSIYSSQTVVHPEHIIAAKERMQDVQPIDSTEDCLALPDDPTVLQEIFSHMGKPFSLDDLDELPRDDDGWGCLLHSVAG